MCPIKALAILFNVVSCTQGELRSSEIDEEASERRMRELSGHK